MIALADLLTRTLAFDRVFLRTAVPEANEGAIRVSA